MSKRDHVFLLLGAASVRGIARRYFVVNGFDGALTMLGLNIGFLTAGDVAVPVVVSACLGAAVALGVSGFTSAYMSETAEKERELRELEQAMVKDLRDTAHSRSARLTPIVVAAVNGLAPFLVALVIISPAWLAMLSLGLPIQPVEASIAMAFAVIFLLGVFLGRISGTFWLWAGVRTLLIGVVTSLIILAIGA